MNFVVRSTLPLDAARAGLPAGGARARSDAAARAACGRWTRWLSDAIARPRFLTLLLGVFAGLALVLAAVGTYGILSYLVSERKQEIGIRMALGADRNGILGLVLGRGLILSGTGLVLGLVASVGLTRVLKGAVVQRRADRSADARHGRRRS